MKKLLVLVVVLVSAVFLQSCDNTKELTVVATAVPHEEILKEAKPLLKAKGWKLKIIPTDDYYVPNPAVASGSADANFFQHVPFLNTYNDGVENESQKLANAGAIHIEPIGLYSPAGAKHRASIADVQPGDKILMSNNVAELGRLLNLLHAAGLITVNDPTNTTHTIADITSNPKNLVISTTVAPELLVTAYSNAEANLILINGNYALQGNLNPATQSIYLESTANNPYANVIACRPADLTSQKIIDLVSVLKSQTIKDFINSKYSGSVIPAV
jgi:D-methionine transport system substrate-binding protein